VLQLKAVFGLTTAAAQILSEERAGVQELLDTAASSMAAAASAAADSSVPAAFFDQSVMAIGLAVAEDGQEAATALAAFESAVEAAEVCAIDAEWTPDELAGHRSRVALLQLAFGPPPGRVFLVDWLDVATGPVSLAVARLFRGDALILAFGIEQDLPRIGLDVPVRRVLDLQTVGASLLRRPMPSLGDVVAAVLGRPLAKSKALQRSDWEQRPLSAQQQAYAAADAAVLLELHAALNAVLPRSLPGWMTDLPAVPASQRHRFRHCGQLGGAGVQATMSATLKPPWSSLQGIVDVEYTAIFLTPASVSALSMAIPPRHPVIPGHHHITAAHKPRPEALGALFPVGRKAQVRAVAQACDECCQALLVEVEAVDQEWFELSARLHITLSTVAGTPAARSSILVDARTGWTPLSPPLELEGVWGAQVVARTPRPVVPAKIEKKLEELACDAQFGEQLTFKDLAPVERHNIHRLCEELGLESWSAGQGERRKLTVRKSAAKKFAVPPRDGEEDAGASDLRVVAHAGKLEQGSSCVARLPRFGLGSQGMREVVMDASVWASLVPRLSGVAELGTRRIAQQFHGEVVEGGSVRWHLDRRGVEGPQQQRLRTLLEGGGGNQPLGHVTTVILLRGLSGIGKSRLAHSLAATVAQVHSAAAAQRICSADIFFEAGAGLPRRELKGKSPEEIYRSCFDQRRLGEAHEWCRREFEEALAQGCSVVIVDNTHIRHADYEWYVRRAAAADCEVVVVELSCAAQERQIGFCAARSSHGLQQRQLALMAWHWEPDPLAVRLQAWQPKDSPSPAGSSGSTSLQQWFSDHRCCHHSKARASTHLMMAVGGSSATFIYVPPGLHQEFLMRFCSDPSPKFLVEFMTQPHFPFFLDVDFVGDRELRGELLLSTVRALQQSLKEAATLDASVVVVASPPEAMGDGTWRSGCHFHCPGVRLVTTAEALAVRGNLAARLLRSEPHFPWNDILDEAVYTQSRSLRMVGSRKADRHGRDLGRVYEALLAVGADGAIDAEELCALQADPVRLLRTCSVRCPREVTRGASDDASPI